MNGPVKIMEQIIHHVIGYPIMNRVKTIFYQKRDVIEANIVDKQNNKGIKISTIEDEKIKFTVRVTNHKFYQSRQPGSAPCVIVDLGCKIIKKDHSYNLAKLQLTQLVENLESIRKTKHSICNFGSLVAFIFFYCKICFPHW